MAMKYYGGQTVQTRHKTQRMKSAVEGGKPTLHLKP